MRRTTPQHSFFLPERMKEMKARVILNSDFHSISTLSWGYTKALEELNGAGFTALTVLTENGREEKDIRLHSLFPA